MKKFLSLVLIFVLMSSISGCTMKIDPVGEIEKKAEIITGGIEGTWQIARAEFENTPDPMKKVIISLLKDYLKEGSVISFEKDNKAKVDGTDISYSVLGDTLTLTWDNSKNFQFELSLDNGMLELEMEDAAEFKLKK